MELIHNTIQSNAYILKCCTIGTKHHLVQYQPGANSMVMLEIKLVPSSRDKFTSSKERKRYNYFITEYLRKNLNQVQTFSIFFLSHSIFIKLNLYVSIRKYVRYSPTQTRLAFSNYLRQHSILRSDRLKVRFFLIRVIFDLQRLQTFTVFCLI